jgi:hypothetical protein
MMCTFEMTGGATNTFQELSLSHVMSEQSADTLPLSFTPESKAIEHVLLSGLSCAWPVFHPPPFTMVAIHAPGTGGEAHVSWYRSPSGIVPEMPVQGPGIAPSQGEDARGRAGKVEV